jgi:putative membrane protein
MMWWYGNGMGAWGYTLMTVSNVLFWALIIVGLIALVRYVSRGRGDSVQTAAPQATPEQILARRFAAGEINEQEYRDRLSVIRDQVRR